MRFAVSTEKPAIPADVLGVGSQKRRERLPLPAATATALHQLLDDAGIAPQEGHARLGAADDPSPLCQLMPDWDAEGQCHSIESPDAIDATGLLELWLFRVKLRARLPRPSSSVPLLVAALRHRLP